MKITVIGGGWLTGGGSGNLGGADYCSPGTGYPDVPDQKTLFPEPLKRYGRFDLYTKIGISAAAAAVKQAGIDRREKKLPTGMIVSSYTETLSTDYMFYESTLISGGQLASPHKFSYTLPGIVIGECSLYYLFSGHTYTVGDRKNRLGEGALKASLLLLESGQTETVVCGWLEAPPEQDECNDLKKGALFCVLTSSDMNGLYSFSSDDPKEIPADIDTIFKESGKIPGKDA